MKKSFQLLAYFLLTVINPAYSAQNYDGVYWLDDSFSDAKNFSTDGNVFDLSIDLSSYSHELNEGFHHINIRMKETSSGIWGTSFRKAFYYKKPTPASLGFEGFYWIDNDTDNALSFNTNDGVIDLSAQLGDLKEGLHFINLRVKETSTGIWGSPFRKAFYCKKESCLLGYRHYLNGEYLGYVELEPTNEKEQLISLDLLDNAQIDRSKRLFEFKSDIVTSSLRETLNYELQFNSTRGWGKPEHWDIDIDENHTAVVHEVSIPSHTQLRYPRISEFEAIKFTADGSSLLFQSSHDAILDLYRDGALKFTLSPEDLKSQKETIIPEGEYYGILQRSADVSEAPDSLTLSIMRISTDKAGTPEISYDGHTVGIVGGDADAEIFYTVDNPDMTGAVKYEGSFDAGGIHTIRAIAKRDGLNDSEPAVLDILAYSDMEHAETAEAGHLAEAFGWMDSDTFERIESYAIGGPLDEEDYAVIRTMKGLVGLDISEVSSSIMPSQALKGLKLITVNLPNATETYGEDIFSGNDALCAIFTASPAAIPGEAFGDFRNPNLLLYASGEYPASGTEGSGIDWLTNVISDGENPAIPLLTLTDGEPYFCPKEFNADEARFVKSFSKKTILGGIQGWETMTVPFDVTEIRKSDFTLVPFVSYEGDGEGIRPFWLYTPSGTAWEKSEDIKAHTPYIISMPNCDAYEPSFNISGDVTFIGGSQTISATPEGQGTVYKSGHLMWTNFSRISKAEGLYVVNEAEVDGATGNYFVSGEHDVRPFECYVTTSTAKKMLPIFEGSDVETLGDFTMKIWSERRDILIESPYSATLCIHDLTGQLVRTVKAETGTICRVRDVTPGIYFIGDRKVLVK